MVGLMLVHECSLDDACVLFPLLIFESKVFRWKVALSWLFFVFVLLRL